MIPLLILGLLKQVPGSSGYELLRLMNERHYKYIVNFTKGSFYYHLQQLEEKEQIIKLETLLEENPRESNHYALTDQGEQEFLRLMSKFGSQTDYVNLSFYGPLLFADDYPREQFVQLIEQQILESQKKIFLIDDALKDQQNLPKYFRKMLENSKGHHLVNITWFQSLLAES